MKTTRRIATLLLALVMILSLATVAFADDDTTPTTPADGTIVITLPTGGDATNTYSYTIYKVFDATYSGGKISYTLTSNHTNVPDGFTLENGYVTYAGTDGTTDLTTADIAAIAAYVTDADKVQEVTSTAGATTLEVTGLGYGYFYITTSTGTVVTIDSTSPYAEVNDKNTVPTVDKDITKIGDTKVTLDEAGEQALAEVGTTVTYTATITVAEGAKNYVFHDTMGTGLTYDSTSLRVQINGTDVGTANYSTTTASGDTFTVTFDNDYIKTLTKSTVITLTYSATVNSDALTVDTGKNTAYISYGDSNKTTSDTTELYNANISVNKFYKDSAGASQALEGAGFVLKNSAGKYYKYHEATETASAYIEWVDSIEAADEHKSGNDGIVDAFIGLADGTYYLEEKTVPAGYNKAADTEVKISGSDFTAANLSQTKDIENKSGSLLPSTGGIGTTIFYIVGGLLVAGAVILLVTKKRMSAEQ